MTELTRPDNAQRHTPEIEFTALLSALEGLAYVAAADGTLLAVGEPAWSDFALANGAPMLHGSLIIGRNLFDGAANEQVRDLQRRLHQAVLDGRQPVISFEYRCDAPDTVRRMRMAMTLLPTGSGPAVLYHSVVLEQNPRPRMSLFEAQEGDGEPKSPTVSMCSYCHDIAWPVGAPAEDRTWIPPEAYYQRGGSSEVRVSHGICPACYERLTGRIG